MLQFKAIDSDGNKLIDKKEAKDHLESISYFGPKSRERQNDLKFEQGWNKMDVNRDGKISPKEFDSSLGDSVEDTKINNRNGKISPKEFDSSLKESVEDPNIIKFNADIDI